MRRLNRDDSGVAIVLVTVGMAALLLMAALGLDVGSMLLNKARAQNSADSQALAAAINCAVGEPYDTSPLPPLRSEQTASFVPEDCSAGQIEATVHWMQDFSFIPKDSVPGRRPATAKWGGTINSANVLPIAIAQCEWSEALLDGTADITVYLDDPKKQNGCSSLPGGFSQLQSGETTCSIEVDESDNVDGKPGGDLKKKVPCISPLPKEVLVPIYDESMLSKENHDNGHGPYHILGYAMFRFTGYSFNGGGAGSLDAGCPTRPDDPTAVDDKGKPLKDPKYCIQGDFIRFVAPSDALPGPSEDFGVTTVSLVS